MSDYLKYRGKCKEFAEKAAEEDALLRVVRGHYWCPISNEREPHWWCERPDGRVVDPTARQFQSKGLGEYEEFDGYLECSGCGKRITEAEIMSAEGNYAFCSGACHYHFVM